MDKKEEKLKDAAKLVRYYSLISTTKAKSGHPTSSLSAADLMTTLFFNFLKYDTTNPDNPNNDRVIFSKGHASPLLYALWAAAGKITEKQILTLRKFSSVLEGHPTPRFKYTEAATGSLGQGLSIGLGMALNAKYLDKLPYKTYVLLGDSEMAEGSVWEAIQLASYYKLNNLIAILDVNHLGQRGETMYGHHTKEYEKRISAFGWKTITIDGHNIKQIIKAFDIAKKEKARPVMIIAKTIKGKGVSFIENKNGWHGKALSEEQLKKALKELGKIKKTTYKISKPTNKKPKKILSRKIPSLAYKKGAKLATRKAYGNALARIYPKYPEIIALDAEVSNSTYSKTFKDAYPKRFFEMFIAEQNMVGTAIGLSRMKKIPFVSTFSAFFTRAFDQIRMSNYSNSNIKFIGSHCGVSIGKDGSSQMGLEDISMFRTPLNSVVLYPSDAVSTEKLVEEAAKHKGLTYIRTTRMDTPVIYKNSERFRIGGSKTVKKSKKDKLTIIGAGVTLFEALKAYEIHKEQNIHARIIDLYSIKPLDKKTLLKAAKETKNILVVEDHYKEGGIGEAVLSALAGEKAKIVSLHVSKMPRSGTPEKLLDYEEISWKAIIKKAKGIIK